MGGGKLTMLQSGGVSLLEAGSVFQGVVRALGDAMETFFSKFKVFMIVSAKSLKPVKLPVFG